MVSIRIRSVIFISVSAPPSFAKQEVKDDPPGIIRSGTPSALIRRDSVESALRYCRDRLELVSISTNRTCFMLIQRSARSTFHG
jgi:hypothetical protein